MLRVDGSSCSPCNERSQSELSSSLPKELAEVRTPSSHLTVRAVAKPHTHLEAFPLPFPLPFLPPLLVGALLCLLASGCTSGSAAPGETFSRTISSPSLKGLKLLMVGMPILWVTVPIFTEVSAKVALQFAFEVSRVSGQAQYATMKGSTAARAKPLAVVATGNCKWERA